MSINYVVSVKEGWGEWGQKSPILHNKKTTKRVGGGQKLSILRWQMKTPIVHLKKKKSRKEIKKILKILFHFEKTMLDGN